MSNNANAYENGQNDWKEPTSFFGIKLAQLSVSVPLKCPTKMQNNLLVEDNEAITYKLNSPCYSDLNNRLTVFKIGPSPLWSQIIVSTDNGTAEGKVVAAHANFEENNFKSVKELEISTFGVPNVKDQLTSVKNTFTNAKCNAWVSEWSGRYVNLN